MLDGDAAGRHATAVITARLQPHGSVQVMHLADGAQPDQLSAEAIRQILAGHTHRRAGQDPAALGQGR